jgi:hypothetical protein
MGFMLRMTSAPYEAFPAEKLKSFARWTKWCRGYAASYRFGGEAEGRGMGVEQP